MDQPKKRKNKHKSTEDEETSSKKLKIAADAFDAKIGKWNFRWNWLASDRTINHCSHDMEILGLADEQDDVVDKPEEEIHVEKPLAVNKKPFIAKKFRDALRKKDCITGEQQSQ